MHGGFWEPDFSPNLATVGVCTALFHELRAKNTSTRALFYFLFISLQREEKIDPQCVRKKKPPIRISDFKALLRQDDVWGSYANFRLSHVAWSNLVFLNRNCKGKNFKCQHVCFGVSLYWFSRPLTQEEHSAIDGAENGIFDSFKCQYAQKSALISRRAKKFPSCASESVPTRGGEYLLLRPNRLRKKTSGMWKREETALNFAVSQPGTGWLKLEQGERNWDGGREWTKLELNYTNQWDSLRERKS